MNKIICAVRSSFAELAWHLFSWQLQAEKQKAPRSAEELCAARITKLRALLKRTPYWTHGHLLLATEAFAINDIDTAYADAQAAIVLNGDKKSVQQAKRLLARCLLKRGAADAAREGMLALLQDDPQWHDVREDLAAIFVMQGQYAAALEEFGKIPQSQLSAEGHAARQFAQQKA